MILVSSTAFLSLTAMSKVLPDEGSARPMHVEMFIVSQFAKANELLGFALSELPTCHHNFEKALKELLWLLIAGQCE